MTVEEDAAWAVHLEHFKHMLAEGTIILVGPTLGRFNTGIAIFEAPDEAAARAIMEDDPTIRSRRVNRSLPGRRTGRTPMIRHTGRTR